MADEFSSEIVKQSGVGGRGTLSAEITGSIHDATAHVVLPQPIHDHPSQQLSRPTFLVSDPMGESDAGGAVFASGEPVGLGGVLRLQDPEEGWAGEPLLGVGFAALEEVDFPSVTAKAVGRPSLAGRVYVYQCRVGGFLGMVLDVQVQFVPVRIPGGEPLEQLGSLFFVPLAGGKGQKILDVLRDVRAGAEVKPGSSAPVDIRGSPL